MRTHKFTVTLREEFTSTEGRAMDQQHISKELEKALSALIEYALDNDVPRAYILQGIALPFEVTAQD
jgi:hypothetical protein